MTLSSLHLDLAPTGTLRVGINYGNPVLATKDPNSGQLSGVAVDLARELGRRTDLPLELVGFESAGKMVEGLQAGAWDVAFLAVDPGREQEISFTAPYIEIEGTFLVPPVSALRAIADVDHENVRVGVSSKSAYDLFLSRNLKHAELVRESSPEAAFELIVAGKVDALGGVRQHLVAHMKKFPGSRVLEGRFMAIQQALGIPKSRAAGLNYLREFIEDVKASGFVARALEKAGVQGVSIAPMTTSK
ncbi:MAG TPA: ABC transporter substrate-binding protein [Candidatus Binatia bacterium]|nr:ABC transporter substrate-binding protein [Candidatus Binatia bacterium]